MGRFARVTSIDVLQTLSSALHRYRGEAVSVLDDLEIEIRRVLEWIHHDRKEYWTHELRRGWEGVSQARLQLQQAKLSRRMAGHEPACIDENRALDRAKRRLETAQQKVEAVQHWTHALDRAIDEFQRSRTQFAGWLDTDMAQAVAALGRMSESLASYTSLAAPTDAHAPVVGPGVDADEEETPPNVAADAKDKGTEP